MCACVCVCVYVCVCVCVPFGICTLNNFLSLFLGSAIPMATNSIFPGCERSKSDIIHLAEMWSNRTEECGQQD